MDENNPAVKRQVAMSPARLEELATDKGELLTYLRKLQVLNAMNIHQMVAKPNVPLATRVAFAEQLNKATAQVAAEINNEKNRNSGGVLPGSPLQIVFHLSGNAKPPTSVEVIEAEPPTSATPPALADEKEESQG